MLLLLLAAIGSLTAGAAEQGVSGLYAARLGVIFNLDSAASVDTAHFYAQQRGIPAENLLGVHLPAAEVMSPQAFKSVRDEVLQKLPTQVQSLLLVWSQPYAVGCMSITSAFAAGYRGEFCEPGCAATAVSPLYDTAGWLPADLVGWWPAMLLPGDDRELSRSIIARGLASDGTTPAGTVYLVTTQDAARNVRAAGYSDAQALLANRVDVVRLSAPIRHGVGDVLGYFTGAARVEELNQVRFRPGGVADHLTSVAGVLSGTDQTTVLAWLRQGATGSYGTVSEPCNHLEKFPNPAVLFDHYTRGETLLESYWKSVRMPGQGLFVGEPLARPFASRH